MSSLMPYKKLMPAEKKSTGNETAIDLIYNFLNEPALRGLSDLAIGGTFPLRYFQLGNGSCAKQFWYCYDNRPSQPEAYLALEDSIHPWPRNRKASEVPTTPESDALHRPEATFTFDDQKFDRSDIAQVDLFIQQHKDTNLRARSIRRIEVSELGKAFVHRFGGKEENTEFCYYPLAYFENFTPETGRYVIDDFMEIGDIQYVRYYFGLDTAKDHGANRLRVVLFPISKEQTKLQAAGGVNDVLQLSWPPFGHRLYANNTLNEPNGIDQKREIAFPEFESAAII